MQSMGVLGGSAAAAAAALVLMILGMVSVGAMGQLSSDCTSVIASLSPCLNYVTGESSTPSVPCCTQLASVVQSDPECLCELINGGGASMGITINRTQALALPAACNVQTPPISGCNGTAGPSAPPPTGGGSNGVPSSGVSNALADAAQMTVTLALSLLVVAYVSLPQSSYFVV